MDRKIILAVLCLIVLSAAQVGSAVDPTSPASTAEIDPTMDVTSPAITDEINLTAGKTSPPNTAGTTATIAPVTEVFTLIFRIKETFVPALANPNSKQFKDKAEKVTREIEPLYKKAFKNFHLMQIFQFRNGSIVTHSLMSFLSGANVTDTKVKDVLAKGVNSLTFPVEPNSINVTHVISNSMPPVIASSLSMIWMSLLPLLLSAALHC
ncbi:uncharacterized protein LOC132882901 [Neoarius graeffei]|uniref:uncharacterized protein LOC132882901 n=1 Tax=Neoarius graeffei TaxID=443677 RepID=UPI00298C22CB|nr:uncharacterized protein LOC132882901 [Neoarius graeffei]XP_060771988.1 uncharacterized protein LOC132882901 [Neoarius graeffei]XP_060771989.1 uncharacterized protein LOC132882901 [Neoarius graeffei]